MEDLVASSSVVVNCNFLTSHSFLAEGETTVAIKHTTDLFL